MDLLKEAFIEGYKQRAESSNLIFDNASRMYAISLFDKWKSEQLLLYNVVGQSEQYCDCDKPTLGDNVWTCGCGKPFKKKDK